MYCPNCGNTIGPNENPCPKCGAAKGAGKNYCASCGKRAPKDAKTCPACGAILWNGRCENPDCVFHWRPKPDDETGAEENAEDEP